MDRRPFLPYLPPELRQLPWRAHPLDGKLLLFERRSGLNVLLEGEETAQLRRVAPRTALIAITNACNLSCAFCYRDRSSRSLWRYDTLLDFCRGLDEWGVLELAFGGGEPLLFPRWADFLRECYETTGLCLNFTTNGMLLTSDFLREIAGRYGQIRISLYDTNNWADTIRLLVRHNARFGVNWLITPRELPAIAATFTRLLQLGVRDFLLLSYKGDDPALHLQPQHAAELSAFLSQLYTRLGSAISLKLDSCWGGWLPDLPRLFEQTDCGAGDEFLSITSDKRVKDCSFQETSDGIAFETVDELRALWEQRRCRRHPARIAGCARLPGRGLGHQGAEHHAVIHLARV